MKNEDLFDHDETNVNEDDVDHESNEDLDLYEGFRRKVLLQKFINMSV